MPPAIAAVAAWYAAATALQVAWVAFQVFAIVSSVYGASQAKKKAKADQERNAAAQKAAYNASLKDRTVTRIAADSPAVTVYGRARVGSAIVAVFTSGTRDEYKHLICIHAAHECDAFEEIYINSTALGTLDGDGFPTTGKYVSSVRVKKHLGTAADTADATLISECPTKWDSNAVLRGYCYTYIRLDLNEQEFQGGLPSVEVLLRGKKLYDVRDATTAWSQNPTLVIYDYLTSEICGVASTDLPTAQFITAANVCDEAESFGNKYTFNGTVTADQDQAKVLEQMAQSMAGSIVSTTWDISAGKYVAPVLALQQEDIVGSISIIPGTSDADLYNGVKGQYISSETLYVATDFKPYQNSTYVTTDGGELWTNIDFPFTDSVQRVHNLARIFTEDQRNGYTVKAGFSLKAWDLKIGQRVTLTSELFGWSAKIFRVTDKTYSLTSPVELTLKEDASSIWDYADAVTADSTPNTDLPDPFAIAAPTGLALASGTSHLFITGDGTVVSRIKATFTPPANVLTSTILVQYKRSADSVWTDCAPTVGDAVETYISPVDDGVNYDVRVCAKNFIGQRSAWATVSAHTVIGKTESPPAFDTFTVMAQPDGTRQYNFGYATLAAQPADWLGAEIRYISGTDAAPDWDSMSPLQDSSTYYTSSPVELNSPLSGTYTFACKSLDTTGNASTYLVRSITLPSRRLGDVFDEYYEHFDGWPGTLTGCHVQEGVLEAIDTTTWATLPATWAAWTRWNFTPTSPITYVTPARDFGAIIVGQVNSTVDADGSIVQELATSADGSTWSAWSSAAAPFTTRYLKLRLTVTATGGSPVPIVREWGYWIRAAIRSEYINDCVISSLTGAYRIGTGDIRIPISNTYALIKRTSIVVQDNSAGTWTYARIDQSLSPSPRWQFRLNGTLADPSFVDFFVEGY